MSVAVLVALHSMLTSTPPSPRAVPAKPPEPARFITRLSCTCPVASKLLLVSPNSITPGAPGASARSGPVTVTLSPLISPVRRPSVTVISVLLNTGSLTERTRPWILGNGDGSGGIVRVGTRLTLPLCGHRARQR